MSTSQTLTLTVARPQAMPPGCRRSAEFAQRGGRIGRSEDCDWVLAASGISRTHALVRYLNGIYFIEDRSTNGMLLNGAPMSRGEPATLSQGDRLQLDSFLIEVELRAATDGEAPSAVHDDAFPGHLLPQEPAPARGAGGAGEIVADPVRVPVASDPLPAIDPFADDGLLAGLGEHDERELDPLRLLDQAPDPSADAVVGGWNHTPAAADHFQPPRPVNPPAQLPERWDLTTGEWAGPTATAPPPPSAAKPPAPPMFSPPSIPDFDELLDFGPASPQADAAAPDPEPETASPPAAGVPGVPVSTPSPTPAPASGPPAATPPSAPSAPSATPAPPGTDGELDQILGIVVDGVMEVLRARAEIKNTFRLPVTIIQRTENNPLKFAATPDEAIRKLMAPDSGAFLAGAAAFEDAFEDIRGHQVAMLAGMRAAFESLLFHFNPDRHEQEVDSSGKRAFAGKARYWERYRDNFETLVKDPDECFRRLFGDEFARAYEAQLARLKSSRRTRPR